MSNEENGYPSEEDLARIRAWPWKDCGGWMAFVHSIWNWPDWGWTETATDDGATEYSISTGGWSGNEDVIYAMQHNTMCWSLCWKSSERGGHFVFHVRPFAAEAPQAPKKEVEP